MVSLLAYIGPLNSFRMPITPVSLSISRRSILVSSMATLEPIDSPDKFQQEPVFLWSNVFLYFVTWYSVLLYKVCVIPDYYISLYFVLFIKMFTLRLNWESVPLDLTVSILLLLVHLQLSESTAVQSVS